MYFIIPIIISLSIAVATKQYLYPKYLLLKNINPNKPKKICEVVTLLVSLIFLNVKYYITPEIDKKQLKQFRNYVEIPYSYRNNDYIHLLKVQRGKQPIHSIVNEEGKDVISEIFPYLGPNYDCDGVSLCPQDFGHKKIVITMVNEQSFSFEENDTLKIF